MRVGNLILCTLLSISGRDCSLQVSLTTNHTGLNGGGRVPECNCFVRVCIFFSISFIFKYFHYSVWTLRRLCSCTEKITRTRPLPPLPSPPRPHRYPYICVCVCRRAHTIIHAKDNNNSPESPPFHPSSRSTSSYEMNILLFIFTQAGRNAQDGTAYVVNKVYYEHTFVCTTFLCFPIKRTHQRPRLAGPIRNREQFISSVKL